MKHLINEIRTDKLTKLEEFKKEINKFKHAELIEQCGKYRLFNSLIPKSKDISKLTLKELKAYLILREEKIVYKSIESKVNDIKEIMSAGELHEITINIEWTKSATWGANPRGEGWVRFKLPEGMHSERKECAGVTGCGFDKLSTAVANVLNQFAPLLKKLYAYKDKELKKGNTKNLREMFGYGSGYGILPRLEGGVGVECYPVILDKIGFKFTRISNGKSFDVFQITKK